VAYLCKVALMAKFKCAPLHNTLNITYQYNVYQKLNLEEDKCFETENIYLFLL